MKPQDVSNLINELADHFDIPDELFQKLVFEFITYYNENDDKTKLYYALHGVRSYLILTEKFQNN